MTEPHPTKCTVSELLVSHRQSNKHQHFKIHVASVLVKETLFAIKFILKVEEVKGKVIAAPGMAAHGGVEV